METLICIEIEFATCGLVKCLITSFFEMKITPMLRDMHIDDALW